MRVATIDCKKRQLLKECLGGNIHIYFSDVSLVSTYSIMSCLNGWNYFQMLYTIRWIQLLLILLQFKGHATYYISHNEKE